VSQALNSRWERSGVVPAVSADDLQVLRRLSLALVGSAPSLEEIRQFEADSAADRLERWTARYIADWRFVEYFAERLATVLVNHVGGEFGDGHRQRFVEWLGRSIQQGRPYDELVRKMIAGRGYWARDGAVLFVSSELAQNDIVPQRLAARTTRAFLGQRIDCAQCHDHPFATWKQSQFEALAAHFAGVGMTPIGIQDRPDAALVIEDPRTLESRTIEHAVPFDAEAMPVNGTLRERFADWVTHPSNRRFRRAAVNRIWGLMYGRPLVRPVDDIPDPLPTGEEDGTELLDVLGDDWSTHGYDLRRLIHTITASPSFRLASGHPLFDQPEMAAQTENLDESWAVFPITQLTAVQLMRSLQQASSVKTVRIRETATTYTYMWNRERMRQASERYGDSGDINEAQQTASIPQAIQRLSGPHFAAASNVNLRGAVSRISGMASSNTDCLDACYLVCLTRRPTSEEQRYFVDQLDLATPDSRKQVIEDIFWTLLNSHEFSWNH
jgi:hypothetical protein